jgi:hypothetical protein
MTQSILYFRIMYFRIMYARVFLGALTRVEDLADVLRYSWSVLGFRRDWLALCRYDPRWKKTLQVGLVVLPRLASFILLWSMKETAPWKSIDSGFAIEDCVYCFGLWSDTSSWLNRAEDDTTHERGVYRLLVRETGYTWTWWTYRLRLRLRLGFDRERVDVQTYGWLESVFFWWIESRTLLRRKYFKTCKSTIFVNKSLMFWKIIII